METSLKVYADLGSQPSRAVLCFCKINKIPFEHVEIRLGKLQHKSPEFTAINPLQ